MAAAFTIFEKFADVCAALEEADRKELIYAINMYGMFGEEVELPYHLKPIFIALREDIDNSKESRKRGSAGGRPRKKPEVSQDEKQGVSGCAKPPVSETEKPHVSEDAAKTESQTKPDQANTDQTSTGQTKGVRRFRAPALGEVRDYSLEYAAEKGLDPSGFDAEGFIDYYTSNGWRVGRNPMKDWKATVRDWVRKDCKPGGGDVYDQYDLQALRQGA